jgi:hypothetical protein
MFPAAAVLGALLLWLGFGKKKRRADCIDTERIFVPIPLSEFPPIPVPVLDDESCSEFTYSFDYYDDQCQRRAFNLAVWDGAKDPLATREAIERNLDRMFRGSLRILRFESTSTACGGVGHAGGIAIIPGAQDYGRKPPGA